MKKTIRFLATSALLAFAVSFPLFAAEIDDVLSQIERMAVPGEHEPSLGASIRDGIKRKPAQVSQALLPKLDDKQLTEGQLAIYVWALGLAGDRAAVSAIEAVHRRSDSALVRANCLRALAAIGGQQAGDFLLSTLDATQDKDERFEILNLLGQMQYAAALPKAEEVLKEDPKRYWQAIFVFGKMGDKAVPFLLERISNKDDNIRANAINVVGQWLISPGATQPMLDQFWVEKDTKLRLMILSSLERTIVDLSQMEAVFKQVVAKEKDPEVLKFARETLANLNQVKAEVAAFAKKKQISATSFQREYTQLFKSAGKQGSYEVLGVYSTVQDEPKLKALRERILQRDSDEAFYDYQEVNQIIMRNRLAQGLKN